MISFTDVLHDLVRRGLTLRVDQDGNLFIYDPLHKARADAQEGTPAAAAAPRAEDEADDENAADERGAPGGRRPGAPETGIFQAQPPGAQWHGITWQDVPGHDDYVKKMNFSLLKRGLLHGHKACARLEGEPLRQKLHELSERNRHNSRTHMALRRLQAQPPTPPPPAPP